MSQQESADMLPDTSGCFKAVPVTSNQATEDSLTGTTACTDGADIASVTVSDPIVSSDTETVTDPEAEIWSLAGFTPESAKEWREQGYTVCTATRCRAHGITASKLGCARSNGLETDDFIAWRQTTRLELFDILMWRNAGFSHLDVSTCLHLGFNDPATANRRFREIGRAQAHLMVVFGAKDLNA